VLVYILVIEPWARSVKKVGSIRLVTYASSFSALFSVFQMLFYQPSALLQQPLPVSLLSMLNASICTVIPMMLSHDMRKESRVSDYRVEAGILGPLSTIFLWAGVFVG
jgi:hypothetical protein